jgi:hypothetical protein
MNTQNKQVASILFEGGLQKHQPRDEGLAYSSSLLFDSIKYCIKDLTTGQPTDSEKKCIKTYLTKNFQLLNSDYI